MHAKAYHRWKQAKSPTNRNKTCQGFNRNRLKALSESLDQTAETFRAVQSPTPMSPKVGFTLLNKSINFEHEKTNFQSVTPVTSEYVLKPTTSLKEPKMRQAKLPRLAFDTLKKNPVQKIQQSIPISDDMVTIQLPNQEITLKEPSMSWQFSNPFSQSLTLSATNQRERDRVMSPKEFLDHDLLENSISSHNSGIRANMSIDNAIFRMNQTRMKKKLTQTTQQPTLEESNFATQRISLPLEPSTTGTVTRRIQPPVTDSAGTTFRIDETPQPSPLGQHNLALNIDRAKFENTARAKRPFRQSMMVTRRTDKSPRLEGTSRYTTETPGIDTIRVDMQQSPSRNQSFQKVQNSQKLPLRFLLDLPITQENRPMESNLQKSCFSPLQKARVARKCFSPENNPRWLAPIQEKKLLSPQRALDQYVISPAVPFLNINRIQQPTNMIKSKKEGFIRVYFDKQVQPVIERRSLTTLAALESLKKPETTESVESFVIPEKRLLTKRELKVLYEELEKFAILRKRRRSHSWIKRLKIKMKTPQELKREIETILFAQMPGKTVPDKKRSSSLVGIANQEIKQQRKSFIMNTSILLEMQKALQAKEFKDQVMQADPKTRSFFNEIMKLLNEQSLSSSKILKTTNVLGSVNTQKLITQSKLNFDDLFGLREILNEREEGIQVGGLKFGLKATSMIEKLKLALQKLVLLQMKIDARGARFEMHIDRRNTRKSRRLSRHISSTLKYMVVKPRPDEEERSSDESSSESGFRSSTLSKSSSVATGSRSPVKTPVATSPNSKRTSFLSSGSSKRRRAQKKNSGIMFGNKKYSMGIRDSVKKSVDVPIDEIKEGSEKSSEFSVADSTVQIQIKSSEVAIKAQTKKSNFLSFKGLNVSTQQSLEPVFRRTSVLLPEHYDPYRRYKYTVERFQHAVATKMMKTTVGHLRSYDRKRLTLRKVLDYFYLKRSLTRVLPSTEAWSIGQRYLQIGLNQFKNDYLRDIILRKPEYNDYLRVFAGDDDFRTRKIEFIPDDHQREEETSLNMAFSKQTDARAFFDLVKKQNVAESDLDKHQVAAYLAYYEACGREKADAPINMNLISFWNRTQFIYNKQVNVTQAKAVRKFLAMAREHKPSQLREIVIDSCQMTDEILALMLEGVAAQIVQTPDPRDKKCHLRNFVYTNNKFGYEALHQFKKVSNDLIELRLNNIGLSFKSNVFTELTDYLLMRSSSEFLMKLAFTNMALNDQRTIDNVCDILNGKRQLQFVDLSFCTMAPRFIKDIVGQLLDMKRQIRDINLSYNHFNFSQEGSKDFEFSTESMKLIRELLLKAKLLNHVKLSGMAISPKEIFELCKTAMQSNLLMSLHLNDNGITRDIQYLIDVLQIFELTLNDVSNKKIDQIDPNYVPPMSDYPDEEAHAFRRATNIASRVQIYMRFKAPEQTGDQLSKPLKQLSQLDMDEQAKVDKVVNQKRNLFREHLLLGKEFRNYQQQKAVNASKDRFGVGRQIDSQFDNFMVTRVINHPELIFNQRPDWDSNPRKRFWHVDHNLIWQFSNTNECLVCHRYQYTQIYYHRGVLSQNQGLTEIMDKPLLDELRYQYGKDELLYKTQTPLICGSVVQRKSGQGLFDRKLKMLRSQIFALLAICQCREFFKNWPEIPNLKAQIKAYLETDNWDILREMGIAQKLDGWAHILNDMANHNELTDLRAINRPEMSAYNVEQQEWFTFGSFLKPGYHQVIIYDPAVDRAYCTDFVVKLNQRDFVYPEYPIHTDNFDPNKPPDVWLTWTEDSPKQLQETFDIDTHCANFDRHRLETRVIKNEVDAPKVFDLVRDNMDKIVLFQKHLLSIQDPKYPKISFDSMFAKIMEIQQDARFNKTTKLQKAHIELCFQSAIGTEGAGMRGAMQRSELLNFLIRLVQQWQRIERKSKDKISDGFAFFMHLYVETVTETSIITLHRKLIRSSVRLNDMLFHNKRGLQDLYQESMKCDPGYSQAAGFSVLSARYFFAEFVEMDIIKVSQQQIDDTFIHSMMTVHNEFVCSRNYKHLLYIEWLEMICRICAQGYPEEHEMASESIANKVQFLLKPMWQWMYNKKIWRKSDEARIFVPVGAVVILDE